MLPQESSSNPLRNQGENLHPQWVRKDGIQFSKAGLVPRASSSLRGVETTVASGLARLIEPKLRIELGYFYNEFIGIHDNYDRYNQFTEREVLPRIATGADSFYGPDGRLLPIFVCTRIYKVSLLLIFASSALKHENFTAVLKRFNLQSRYTSPCDGANGHTAGALNAVFWGNLERVESGNESAT